MGRYYNGDIDGKFWFAVQSSDAADRFGAMGTPPSSLNYYFDEDNIEDLEEELKSIKETAGENWDKLNTFFNEVDGYNTEMVMKALDIDDEKQVKDLISDYADHQLGTQILECVKETGQCSFEAEC